MSHDVPPSERQSVTGGSPPLATAHPEDRQETRQGSRTVKEYAVKAAQFVGSLAMVAFVLGWLVPHVGNTSWPEILHNIQRLGWGKFAYLFALMLAGLYTYTFTLSASLPGLTHAQALMANLSGSGVSNTMPGGGATGSAATYAIFRSWGFSHQNIGTSMIVTSCFNMLLRLLLPLAALAWLLAAGTPIPNNALIAAGAAAALGGVVAALFVAIVASGHAAHRIGSAVNACVRVITAMFGKEHHANTETVMLDMRQRIILMVRQQWHRLTIGIVGFLLIHAWMFRECLDSMGVHIKLSEMFAGYAVSRVSTVISVTPGAIGSTEAFPLPVLMAFGGSGPSVTAGLILYALFSHILEIPLGLIAGAAWWNTRGRYYRQQIEESPPQAALTDTRNTSPATRRSPKPGPTPP